MSITHTKPAVLEHVNITVADPDAAANLLVKLFGWKVRWAGEAIHDGRTVHVGGEDSYVALFTAEPESPAIEDKYFRRRALNHIGVVVDDLDAVEAKVVEAGFVPHSHRDYEPGRRFYFDDGEGVEYEVVSYAPLGPA